MRNLSRSFFEWKFRLEREDSTIIFHDGFSNRKINGNSFPRLNKTQKRFHNSLVSLSLSKEILRESNHSMTERTTADLNSQKCHQPSTLKQPLQAILGVRSSNALPLRKIMQNYVILCVTGLGMTDKNSCFVVV